MRSLYNEFKWSAMLTLSLTMLVVNVFIWVSSVNKPGVIFFINAVLSQSAWICSVIYTHSLLVQVISQAKEDAYEYIFKTITDEINSRKK